MSSSYRHVDIFSKYNQDEFKEGSLGQPKQNHHFALHPTSKDPLFKQIYDCRDMFYDPHWELKNTVLSGLKGSFIATNLFGAMAALKADKHGFLYKKQTNAVYQSPFGIFKLTLQKCKPFLVGGFVLGSLWHVWYNLLWTANSTKHQFTDHVLGYGFFASFATAFVQHPKNFPLGFLGGCILGAIMYTLKHSNQGPSRGTYGSVTYIGQKTEEERQHQAAKDYIYFLSQQPLIRHDELIPIQNK